MKFTYVIFLPFGMWARWMGCETDVWAGGRFTFGGEKSCSTLGGGTGEEGISTLGVGSAGIDGGRGGRRRDNGVGGGGGNGGMVGIIVWRGDGGGGALVPALQSLAVNILGTSALGVGTLKIGVETGDGG